MARGDIKIRTQIPAEFSIQYTVASGTAASISAGEPALCFTASGSATGNVAAGADGAGVIGGTAATNGRFAGIAKSDSTETASVAGVVDTWLPLPGLVYEAKAKTASTADTAAEVAALVMKQVFFDLTTSVWTVDAAATDAAANALVIIGGDYRTQRLYFTIKPTWSILGNVTTLS